MRKMEGRVVQGMLAVLLLVVLVGVKMHWRGWVKLDQAKQTAQNTQAVSLEWPPKPAPASESVCHTVKLTLAQVDKAMEEGFNIDRQRRCITKEDMAHYQAENARYQQAREQAAQDQRKKELAIKLQAELEAAVAQQVAQGGVTLKSLAQAREGFATQVQSVVLKPPASKPFPQPPADLFLPLSYRSGSLDLKAYVSPSPKDGQRHPLVVWLTGGDTNSLDDFWTEGSSNNDQSASAFRKAGMVMLFPTLRGGNTNPGQREYFWGEVDDVIAAILQAAKLPYVDSSKIYLGGHSTGGTLALLVAATGLPIQGVFAFGPVEDVSNYPMDVNWKRLSPQERQLRAPINWLTSIQSPTWIIEGDKSPGNLSSLNALCAANKSPQVHCVAAGGLDHYSVLQPMTRRIAAQLALGQAPKLESAPIQ